jgi:hypothetical protein
MFGLNGWLFLVAYLATIALIIAALYFLIRVAVLHALKAHTRWIDQGKQ